MPLDFSDRRYGADGDRRVKFAVLVRTTCGKALSNGEALAGVSLRLNDGNRFVDAEVEAIRGSVLFIGERGGGVHQVDADAIVEMDVE